MSADLDPAPAMPADAAPGDPTSPLPGEPVPPPLSAAQAAADALLLHLQLAIAAVYGPTEIVSAAMADVQASADALAASGAIPHPDVDRAGAESRRLRATLESIEREADVLALELARRRADIDDVLRRAAGHPGTYDANGRTAATAGRRARGAG